MKRSVILVLLVCAVLTLSGAIIYQDGAQWRIPDVRRVADTATMRNAESDYCDEKEQSLPKPNDSSILVTCSREVSKDSPHIYVWGDSHARHLIAGFSDTYPNHNIRILYYTSCLAQSGLGPFTYTYEGRAELAEGCRRRNQNALEFFKNQAPTTVIIHQYFGYEGQFSEDWQESTEFVVSELRSYGHHVAFVGGVVQPGKDFANCLAVPGTISYRRIAQRCVSDEDLSAEIVSHNSALEARFPEFFINPNSFFCDERGTCSGFDGELLFRDKHHLSVEGSRRFVQHIKEALDDLNSAESPIN